MSDLPPKDKRLKKGQRVYLSGDVGPPYAKWAGMTGVFVEYFQTPGYSMHYAKMEFDENPPDDDGKKHKDREWLFNIGQVLPERRRDHLREGKMRETLIQSAKSMLKSAGVEAQFYER